MDNFYVALVYLLMIFLPCAFAEWGYIFTAEWWELRALQRDQRRAKAEIPLNQAIASGFAAPAANRAVSSNGTSFAPVRRSRPASVSPSASMNSHESALRVAERLATLMEVHRLVANGLLDLPIDRAMQLAAESPLFADPVSTNSGVADPRLADSRVARPRTVAANAPVTRTAAANAPVTRTAAANAPVTRTAAAVSAAPAAPRARVAPPSPPVYRPAPPAPAATAPAMPRTAPVPAVPPISQPMVQTAPQPFRTPMAAVPSRASADMAEVYALYGCDEILPPDPPATPPHESSGEISVAA